MEKNLDQLAKIYQEKKRTNDFGKIYDILHKDIYNWCLKYTKNKEIAEDLTHDIFIKIDKEFNKFKFKSSFKTWCYRITFNECMNFLNKDKKENTTELNEDVYNYIEEPSDKIILESKIELLNKTLEMLNPNDSLILLMKYQKDLSINDIQEILNIGESAAKMRLKRAKLKFIEIYNDL